MGINKKTSLSIKYLYIPIKSLQSLEKFLNGMHPHKQNIRSLLLISMLMSIIICFILSQGFEDEGSKRRGLARDVFGLIVNKKESDHNFDILASFIYFLQQKHSAS